MRVDSFPGQMNKTNSGQLIKDQWSDRLNKLMKKKKIIDFSHNHSFGWQKYQLHYVYIRCIYHGQKLSEIANSYIINNWMSLLFRYVRSVNIIQVEHIFVTHISVSVYIFWSEVWNPSNKQWRTQFFGAINVNMG